MYAVKKLNHFLLGRPATEDLGLVQRVNAVQTETDVVKKFPKLFGGIGRLEEEYNIVLRDDLDPTHHPPHVALPFQYCPRSRLSWNA